MADVPPWAEALLSSCLRAHGQSARALRRAIAAFGKATTLYDPPETRAAYQHVIDGLQKHLATLPASEAERGP